MTPGSSVKSGYPPASAVALCGWLFPGAGYFLRGERVRAVIVAVSVLFIFVAGLLIGGVSVVETPKGISPGAILDHPWFIGQVMTGPVSIAAAVAANRLTDGPYSTSRSSEIGMLYTAIAGMLNLLVIIDSTHRAFAGDAPPEPDDAPAKPGADAGSPPGRQGTPA